MTKQEYLKDYKQVVKDFLTKLKVDTREQFDSLIDIIDDEDLKELLIKLIEIENYRSFSYAQLEVVETYFIIEAIKNKDITFEDAIKLYSSVNDNYGTRNRVIETLFNYTFDGEDSVVFDQEQLKTILPDISWSNIHLEFICNNLKVISDDSSDCLDCRKIKCNNYNYHNTSDRSIEFDDEYDLNPTVNTSITLSCNGDIFLYDIHTDSNQNIDTLDLSNCPKLTGIGEQVLVKVNSKILLPEQASDSSPILLNLVNKDLPSNLKIYKPAEKCRAGTRTGRKEKFEGHIVKI